MKNKHKNKRSTSILVAFGITIEDARAKVLRAKKTPKIVINIYSQETMTQEELDNKFHEINMACARELAEVDNLLNENKKAQHDLLIQINSLRESINRYKEGYAKLLNSRSDIKAKYEMMKQHLIVSNPKTGKKGVLTLKDAHRLRRTILNLMKEGLTDTGIDLEGVNVQFLLNGEGIEFHLITPPKVEEQHESN